ncbi:MAG: amidohydrolase [Flavobacteriales bacterium]|nr:amidohydrolase [Flavobacteriales bacterium]
MRDLKVILVQSMLHWENAVANRAMFAEKLAALKDPTDLIVLPEMFTTGFTMNTWLAETMDGPTVAWLREQADRTKAAIYGSVIIEEGGSVYNRGLYVTPNGSVTYYDKRHLFRFANENDHFTAGTERVIVELGGWRILLQICFDLRFPVFSRNRQNGARADYDAILYVANWPDVRSYPWSQLLIARAIENQCYVIGVNRVGMDGKGIHYSGDSAMIDPRGAVETCTLGKEECRTVTLQWDALEDFRAKFPVGLDADGFELDL